MIARTSGTKEWTRALFKPKVELAVRTQMRKLQLALDARTVALSQPRCSDGYLRVTYVGDADGVPISLPERRASVPSFVDVRLVDGGREKVVVHTVRLGVGLPTYALAVIAPADAPHPKLFDATEQAVEKLEVIIVARL